MGLYRLTWYLVTRLDKFCIFIVAMFLTLRAGICFLIDGLLWTYLDNAFIVPTKWISFTLRFSNLWLLKLFYNLLLTTPVFFKHFWSLFNIYIQIWKYPGLPLNVAIHVPGNLGVVLFHTLFYPALKHTNK